MPKEILTAEEICTFLKIPRSTLYKLIGDGKIPAFRVGRHWRFEKEKIEEWMVRQTNNGN